MEQRTMANEWEKRAWGHAPPPRHTPGDVADALNRLIVVTCEAGPRGQFAIDAERAFIEAVRVALDEKGGE
jgi:hypothetical protein